MGRACSLKAKLQAGTNTLGCMITTRSADAAEILAYAGFDFLFIDHEHGPGSLGDAVDQMRAMKGTGTSSLVRVPCNDALYIRRVLDAGADAVLCPMVESASQAQAVVEACLFPPRGHRGAAAGIRAALYGYDPEFADRLDQDLLIVIAIETARAVECLDEIAAIPHIDAIFIGPRDLSSSIAKLNQFHDPEVLALVKRAEGKILASGKYLGSALYPGRSIVQMFNSGYRLLVSGSDAAFLCQGAKSLLDQKARF
jgi:4-hydroxy-2-oxoheptanedioate aldolase